MDGIAAKLIVREQDAMPAKRKSDNGSEQMIANYSKLE